MMNEHTDQPLSILIGSQLSSVEFVQDYIQLRFDGPTLTALQYPKVKVGDNWFFWGECGYRDMLCERIGKKVSQASLKEGDEIRLDFEDDSSFLISLLSEHHSMEETAIFAGKNQEWWVW